MTTQLRLGLKFLTVLLLINGLWQSKALADDGAAPNAMAYTHLLPSAYVVPSGDVILGTTLGVGLLDFAEIYTNLFYDFVQVFNAGAKVSLYRGDRWATAVFINYENQNVNVFDSSGNGISQNMTTVSPGAVFSYYIAPHFAGHAGLSLAFQYPTISMSTLQRKSGYVEGTHVNKEFTWMWTDKFGVSAGGSYDFTYEYWGAGASVHMGGVQLGAHYNFGVTDGQLIPILAAGYSSNF